jgi:hypothetical protein
VYLTHNGKSTVYCSITRQSQPIMTDSLLNYMQHPSLYSQCSNVIKQCFSWSLAGPIKANSHIICRSPTMPCHRGFRLCLFHLIYTVRPCLIHTCRAAPVPCHDHAVLKATSQGHGTARHGMCESASAIERWLLLATTQSSTKVVIRGIPISNLNAGGLCETKQHLLKLITLVQEH